MNRFIVFEGIDGCGKDTILEKFVSYLRKKDKYINIWITREPTKITEEGKKISEMLKKDEADALEIANLFIEDRIKHSKIIREYLKNSLVISSRYDLSTLAFQMTMGLDFEYLYNKHKYNEPEGALIPDITVFLKISPEIAFKRINQRGEEKELFEKLDFQKKLVKNYDFVIQKLSSSRNIIILDAEKSVEEVFEELKSKVANLL